MKGVSTDIEKFRYFVYSILKELPAGKITTYGDLAKVVAGVQYSRLVGRFMRENKHPDIIPCYKVVKSDGTLGGYGLGLEKKIELLAKKDRIKVRNGKIVNFEKVRISLEELQNILQKIKDKKRDLHD
ncbi:MAG: MGMT family protein [Candidatus Odinarchaeota archaeon]|nr:MGMT family protein [Candidatus Odinarchaeota archaeon]